MACLFAGSVFAATITRSASRPLEMNTLEPLSSQWSPLSTAVLRMPARSEPADGSVMATARMVSPRTIPGNRRAFCSALPYSAMYGPHNAECSGIMKPGSLIRASSSHMICS
ncbi:Uncharacterised protein [Klebsiella pneumoniae]|nr:Uncharacterised protein [Pseudomonas aeruginosa]SVJ80020.1 Uncharacterised protein [Klebsiella pneumoniae]